MLTNKLIEKEKVGEYLASVTNWMVTKDGKEISRDFTFADFVSALAFVNQVGALAEAEGHHPDIFLHDYKQVTISLSTHGVGGLSENDFVLAIKIDGIQK